MLFDADIAGERARALLELAEGGSLADWMTTWDEPLIFHDGGQELARMIFGEISYAVPVMHTMARVVSLDLSLSNILLNFQRCSDKRLVYSSESWHQKRCAIKLSDFGLGCKLLPDPEKRCAEKAYKRGAQWALAPEQRKLPKIYATPIQTMWNLGSVLHHLLFGLEDMRKVGQLPENAESWAAANPSFWLSAKDLISRMRDRDVASRATAAQVWESHFVKPVHGMVMEIDTAERTCKRRSVPQSARSDFPHVFKSRKGARGALHDLASVLPCALCS